MSSGAPLNSTEPKYDIEDSRFGKIVCYDQQLLFEKREQKGWESGSTLASSLPFFITQLFVANLSYRVLYYLTRPLYLPPFVAQILVRIQTSSQILLHQCFGALQLCVLIFCNCIFAVWVIV